MADTRGRRPVYLYTLLIYILACIALAMTSNYAMLLALRMLQAFGASSVIAIGAGTIADITHPSERGGYLGWYSLGWNLGPVVGPAIGGLLSQYLGWRWIFWILAILAGVHWFVLAFFLPETLRSLVGNGSGYANPTPLQWWRRRKQSNTMDEKKKEKEEEEEEVSQSSKPLSASLREMLLAPLQPLLFAKEKDVLILLVYYGIQYAACYSVTTSIPFVFSKLYGMNEAMIGLTYLANGAGCIAGSIFQGKILNYNYRRMQERYPVIAQLGWIDPDLPLEHVRMRTVWIHALIFNVLIVVYGWCLHIAAHLAIVLAIHVVLGFTSQAIFNAIQTLLVDLFPKKSASITATNNIFRCLLGAIATTLVLPAIQLLGVGWAFTTISGILLLSRIPMILVLWYGPRWRRERAKRAEHKF
ncbi:hypothetical protein EC973_003321 [Apophysomyces ossiformis]|uniref:Major facilitator superfamily (MFS) profile domain-containing protein n=1 Tax=Apophysomyces ossiformis TaxID=679940 RepID=A0A8H7BZI5_9FUNG|nr:hypothetical protein EC973_003321 [Apophysomyces ossiformis]